MHSIAEPLARHKRPRWSEGGGLQLCGWARPSTPKAGAQALFGFLALSLAGVRNLSGWNRTTLEERTSVAKIASIQIAELTVPAALPNPLHERATSLRATRTRAKFGTRRAPEHCILE